MNKKAVLGLDTVRGFLMVILAISILAFAAVIALGILDESEIGETPATISVNNITTVATVDSDSYTSVTGIDKDSLHRCQLTITAATNESSLIPINIGNITISGCGIKLATGSGDTADEINNSKWNITGSATYDTGQATSVTQNVSGGLTNFFDDTGTWFTLLTVVIIILIIAVVILAVNKFGIGGTRTQEEGL